MPFVTINIAGPGTPLLGGGQSDVGHMWFSLTDTDGTVKSYGFSPARDYQGQPLAPGAVNVHGLDDNFYQGRSFTKTIEITQGQYDAMVAFGKDPAAFGFDMQYNGLTNSCIDFTWKAMYIGGLNFINYEGKLWPVWNDTSVSIIADASQRFFRDRNPFVEFDRAIAHTVCTTFFGACAAPKADPLTLDLDGDGIETTGINTAAPVMFDMAGTGVQQSVGWVAADDGFLVRDLNGNGLIDSGTELFGDATTLSNGTKAADGFAALADLDWRRAAQATYRRSASSTHSPTLVTGDASNDFVWRRKA